MQYSLVFLIALALSGAVNIRASPVRSSSEVSEILQEFSILSFTDEIHDLFLVYFSRDPEVRAALNLVISDEFKEVLKKVESTDDLKNFINYLDDSGFDIYKTINEFHTSIGIPPLLPGKLARNVRITGGIAGLIKDTMAELPWEDLKALQHEKLERSPAFAHAIESLHSPKFQELIDALRANEEFQEINKLLSEVGFDIAAAKELTLAMLGLEFPDGK